MVCAAQCVLGHLRSFVGRDVRELEAAVIAADRVAERPDAVRGRRQVGVDQRAAVDQRDARLRGIGFVDARLAPGRDQHLLGRHTAADPGDLGAAGHVACRDAPGAGHDPYALVLQHAQQRLACLGLLAPQRRVAAQHERGLDAEAVQSLRELHGDRAGAADRERFREVARGAGGRRS